MGKTIPTSAESPLRDVTVVDADVHVSTPTEVVTEYLDTPYDVKLRSFSRANYQYRPTSGWDPYVGGKIDSERSVIDPDETYEILCEDFLIDYPVLNVLGALTTVPDTDLAVQLSKAFNDMLLDRFLDVKQNFYGLATIAPQAPDKAAEEIDRVASEDQIVGILLCSTSAQTPLGDPKYDPVYQAVEDNGLMVGYHGTAAGGFVTQFPIQNQGFETFTSIHTLTHAWSQMATVASLIEHGTMTKFPDIDFLLMEAGISWVPYMMWRLNKEHAIRTSEAPLLEKTPEEHIRESLYFSSQPLGEPNDPDQVQQVLDIVGVDSMMFASDYPHWDFDHPNELDKHLRSHFSETEREQVLDEVPSHVFGIRN